MISKTYSFVTRLSAEDSLRQIRTLLSTASVDYDSNGFQISSKETPLPILNFDRRLYSRRNWIGINPFVYVSGVNVQCEVSDNGGTRVTVEINRARAFLFAVLAIILGCVVAVAMPEPLGAIFAVGVSCCAWFGCVLFFASYLMKEEIAGCLRSHNPGEEGDSAAQL